ncbi:hypothetical protein [Haladaptatus caseinilyticus]|uniref:hypothetical protein n=1 Tax=Haladaptatus caseinilyticus TaxID=2993314 RepID=UPI00224ABE16|nr:hypothetical protein [Haladaptatus caseinilyticus]
MVNENDEADAPDRLALSADRGRGILTPSDREFLLGRKTDYTEHSKKQKRNRIRQRLRNAILDFTILFEHLEDRDRKNVFNPESENRDDYTNGIIDMLGFLHLATMGYHVPFKDMLGKGVSRSEQSLAGSDYRMVTVDFNVDPVGQIDIDEVTEQLENGSFDEITDEDLRAFVRLLTESGGFSATSMRSEMKDQMAEFVRNVNRATDRRNQRFEESSN